MKIGRNEPCPCGSGKKFKKCCLLQGEEVVVPVPADLSPSQLVEARGRAFDEGDFGFIYDTYHADSHFYGQFPDRDEYVRHGRDSLAGEFSIRECRVLRERVEGDEAEVIFYLDTLYQGQRAESFELSLFYRTEAGWRYHSSQKMSREDYDGAVEELDWADFDKVKDKVFF